MTDAPNPETSPNASGLPNPQAELGQALAFASILPVFGLFLSLAAVFLGRMAWVRIQKDPALPGKRQALVAMILGGVLLFANAGLVYAVAASALEGRTGASSTAPVK